VEGVLEQGLGPHFTLSGSVFRNWIESLISLQTDSSTGLSVYRNSGEADATGVEVELDGRFAEGLQGSASYSYTHTGRPGSHEILANSPRQLGKLDLSVPVWREKFFASLDAQYTSPVQTLAGDTVSGFSVFNLTLLGHTLGKHLDLSGSFYNILNKKYFDPGRPEDPEDAIQQDGRNFRLKITGRF
jgi:iron complex outermembrane receptor protein